MPRVVELANYHPINATWSSLRRYNGIYWWHDLTRLPSPEWGWHVIELRVTPTLISAYRDDKLDAKVEDTTYKALYGIGLRQHANNSIAIDWWALRKYVESEPIMARGMHQLIFTFWKHMERKQ